VPDVAGEVDRPHAALAQLGVDDVAIGDRAAEVYVGPGRSLGLNLEEVVERQPEHLEHPLAGFRGRVRMLPVDDLRPVAAGEAELEGPVVLAQAALGEEGEQPLLVETDSHAGESRVRAGGGPRFGATKCSGSFGFDTTAMECAPCTVRVPSSQLARLR